MARGTDRRCMEEYLTKVAIDGLQDVGVGEWEDFLPIGVPLIDLYSLVVQDEASWKFPSQETIVEIQASRGLSYRMLEDLEVKEIIVGRSSAEDIIEAQKWMLGKYKEDQRRFPSGTISLDVEEIKTTPEDKLRLLGQLEMEHEEQKISVIPTRKSGEPKVKSCQLPVRIMCGNGRSWVLMIVLNLGWKNGCYQIKKQKVNFEIIDLIRAIPVCTGVGIKSDVEDIESFYSELSGKNIKMQGWIEIGALAVVAGWHLRARGMTALGVNVLGTILNKCASCGDGKWGKRWNELPESLKVYAAGDTKFGHDVYTILATILLHNTFPDPDNHHYLVCFSMTQCSGSMS